MFLTHSPQPHGLPQPQPHSRPARKRQPALEQQKQLTPWKEEDSGQPAYPLLTFRTLGKYHSDQQAPQPAQQQKESLTQHSAGPSQSQCRPPCRKNKYKVEGSGQELPFRANLISMSLHQQVLEGSGRLKEGKRESWREQPMRVRELKKKVGSHSRTMQLQEETYNKTMQMFSSCLTERFAKDLLEDTLLVYSALPRRQPKRNIPSPRKAVSSPKDQELVLPGFRGQGAQAEEAVKPWKSRNWRLKGREMRGKIRDLMMGERGSSGEEGSREVPFRR